MKKVLKFIWINLEMFTWIAALIILYNLSPGESHYTLCPLSNLGFDFCPGCGLGRSINYAMHLDFANSITSHPLGIIAIFIILRRIITLFNINIINKFYYGNKSVTTHSWR